MLKRSSATCRRLSVSLSFLAALALSSQFTMAQGSNSVVLEIDHVSICGSNLDALREDFVSVGLASDVGGPHGNGITQMAIVGFDDASYIELIAPIKPGVTEGSPWAKFMSGDAATCAWAVGTNVLLQEVDRLKKAGVAVTTPERGSRKRPDGMSVEWMTSNVGTGVAGSTMPFIIEDQTPRAWRVQTTEALKGSPIYGVESVVIGVSNLDASVSVFRKAYGWAEPIIEAQKEFGKTAYFPGQPVILASGGGWVSDHVNKFGESPVAYLLGTRDFAGATKKYRLAGGKLWFGQKIGWFDAGKLKGVRLGVIGQ
jgi:hypothetical protein